MAWDNIPQRVEEASGVRVALAAVPGGHVRLFLTVSNAVAGELGWEVGGCLGLELGSGAHLGLVRITPRTAGAVLGKVGKSARSLQARLVPGAKLAEHLAPSMLATFTVQDGALTLTLPPEWELPFLQGGVEAAA